MPEYTNEQVLNDIQAFIESKAMESGSIDATLVVVATRLDDALILSEERLTEIGRLNTEIESRDQRIRIQEAEIFELETDAEQLNKQIVKLKSNQKI